MKKNKRMRLAFGLLAATFLSTSMISGTFAKYVTSAGASDVARVAKFGVTITANGTSFAKTYPTGAKNTTIGTNSVISSENVIAPGTDGEMARMKLAGKPEVAVKVSYAGAFVLNDMWKDKNGDFYCPLVITVKSIDGTTVIKQNDNTASTKKSFEDAVNAAIAAYSKEYGPGTDLSGKGNESLSVNWSWPFEGNDEKDTFLGNSGKAATATLQVTTTVTQID